MALNPEIAKRMPEAELQIYEDVEFFKDKYFTYDLPVPFKGLTLYVFCALTVAILVYIKRV